MEAFKIEDLARRLIEAIPLQLKAARDDLEANFRAVLRGNLGKLDLVTRDEFDAQRKVLERTRARLEALEKQLTELEARLGAR